MAAVRHRPEMAAAVAVGATPRDFHGEKRANATHFSMTDPDARLFRKSAGKEAKLAHMGHLMMENRNGLIVDARLTQANGTAERQTALDMIKDNVGPGGTVGGDKNYDTAEFVAGCRKRGCTPHVSQNNANRRSAIDARTTRHPGYRISTIKRKRIEEPFGWMKTVGGLRKTRHRGRELVEWFFVLTASATISSAFPKSWPQQDESVRGRTVSRKTAQICSPARAMRWQSTTICS